MLHANSLSLLARATPRDVYTRHAASQPAKSKRMLAPLWRTNVVGQVALQRPANFIGATILSSWFSQLVARRVAHDQSTEIEDDTLLSEHEMTRPKGKLVQFLTDHMSS